MDYDIIAKPNKKLTAAHKASIEVFKSVIGNPNPDDNWSSWIGQMVEDMLVLGMGCSEIKQWKSGDKNHPLVLFPVDAASIQLYADWDGSPSKPRYAQFDYKGNRVDFRNDEMLVMKHTPRSNTPFGLSPTEVAVQQIQYLLDAQTYAGKTASNATPKKLLFLGADATERQVEEFRLYFRNEIEGRTHMPIIGGTDDVKSIELGLAGDQALFLQWQSFLIAIIANAFNLDAMKFNAFVGINRSTGDVLDDATDEIAIRPMCQSIEHYVNSMLTPFFGLNEVAEFKFRFTTSYQDRKSLATIHQIELQADKITINEARRESGLPDLPVSPLLGYSKGDLTLSEYRALFGGFATLQDAVGVDNDVGMELNPALQIQKQGVEEKAKADQAKSQSGGSEQQKQQQQTSPKGGNNGVHSAPKPKEKPANQRVDRGTGKAIK
jgi:HK97 family phage portal protein